MTKKIYSSIYNNNINVDKVIEFSNNLLETYKDLKKENYDLVIDLHNNLRSIFLKLLLFKKTYTYNKEFLRRWIYVNTKIKLKIKHITISYIETLKNLGIEDDDQGLDLYIDEKEWKHIIDTYEKDDVIEELSKALHTYPCPIPEISDKDTLKSLNKLKIKAY